MKITFNIFDFCEYYKMPIKAPNGYDVQNHFKMCVNEITFNELANFENRELYALQKAGVLYDAYRHIFGVFCKLYEQYGDQPENFVAKNAFPYGKWLKIYFDIFASGNNDAIFYWNGNSYTVPILTNQEADTLTIDLDIFHFQNPPKTSNKPNEDSSSNGAKV